MSARARQAAGQSHVEVSCTLTSKSCTKPSAIMLTPCFDVKQDETFIIISMRVPYAKVSEGEFYIDGSSFKFYCKPYFLRLCLPGELVEDGRERAVHDIDKGTVIVYVPKKIAGYHFENLGMITSLLSKKPSAKIPHKLLIEVLPGDGEVASGVEEEDQGFDWQIDQQLPPSEDEELRLNKCSSFYGFAEQQTAVFTKLQEELPALVDCPDPDHMTPHERRLARLAHEEASFDANHYLADLMECSEQIECVCQFQPAWCQEVKAWNKTKSQMKEKEPGQDNIPFSDAEKQQLKDLPNKEYLLDKATERALYLGLVDSVFAYAYDYRATEGEHNVESAWTICKLSSTLSWLEVFRGSVGEVVYCSIRRSLCYPLYRHWKLVQCVLQDLSQLFLLGRRKLLQCLLAIRSILNSAEPYYVMNNLYITDYCVWLQTASAKQIQNLAVELKQLQIEKKSMGWELEELELAAQLVAAEDSENTDTSSSDEGETYCEESATNDKRNSGKCSSSEVSTSALSSERLTASEGGSMPTDAVIDTVADKSTATSDDNKLTVQNTVPYCTAGSIPYTQIDNSTKTGGDNMCSCKQPLVPLLDNTKHTLIPTQRDSSAGSDASFCRHHCRGEDCVADLSEDLHTLLTLQSHSSTPHKKLIEDLN